MKQRTIFIPALLTALTLTLTGCGRSAETETPPPDTPAPVETAAPVPATPTPIPAAPPVWGEQVISQDFYAGDGETIVLQLTCTLPKIENPDACPAGAAINAWYAAEGRERLGEAEGQYELQLADFDISATMGYAFYPMLQEMTSQVVYEADGLISVRRELSVTTSGASPQVYRLSEQFDAATGDRLAFADLFSDAEQVMARVTDAFLAAPELASSGLSREEVAVACHPENFYLTGEGYVFWIQGDSLPDIHSPVEVTIPFDQLAGLSRHG